MRIKILFFALAASLILFSQCKSDYENLVTRELNSGIRHDSLLLGIYFGMERSDFYNHCLELNRKSLITNGPENNTAQITLNDYGEPIDLNFYPDFEQNKVYKMRYYFNYKKWAPWNKEFYADKLQPYALDYLSKVYKTSFQTLKKPDGGPLWLSVSGNRQIRVYLKDDKTVCADVSDLSVLTKIKEPSPSGKKPTPTF